MAVHGVISIITLLVLVQAVFIGFATAQSGPSADDGGNNYTSPGVYPARNYFIKRSNLLMDSHWCRTRRLG